MHVIYLKILLFLLAVWGSMAALHNVTSKGVVSGRAALAWTFGTAFLWTLWYASLLVL